MTYNTIQVVALAGHLFDAGFVCPVWRAAGRTLSAHRTGVESGALAVLLGFGETAFWIGGVLVSKELGAI